MNKQAVVLLIVLIFVSNPLVFASVKKNSVLVNTTVNDSLLDGSFLETRDGVRIIHLNGSHYKMGYQLATLLKEDYLASYRAWLACLPYSYEELLALWNGVKDNIPQKYIDEIQGRADALNMSFDEIAIMEVIGLAIYKDKKCCGLACWGPATKDGKLYHFRSCDGNLNTKDPVTGKYASDDQLLIVRNPEEGYSSVVIGLSVEVGSEGGFNENGIGIGYSAVYTSDINKNGIPCGIRKRMVLEESNSLNKAVIIYSQNATCGWNQIISDGKNSTAVVIEQSGSYNKVCRWNDTSEKNYPSWEIDHVLRRGNFFLNPVEAGFREDIYKKSNFLRYVLNFIGFKTEYNYYGYILHYKMMSKAIDEKWGNLDLNNTIIMMRDVYQGKTNNFYGFMKRLVPIYANTFHQWVVCPETGDMAVSFSNQTRTAYLEPIHYFNIYELMNN